MQDKQPNYVAEDEIDLRELFKTIWNKRWFIIVFTAIITILAIVYALMKTPIYEVKSNVRVGYIGSEPLEKSDIIVKMLNIVFNVEDKITKQEQVTSEVVSIATNKKLKDFIEIKTQAISNKDALEKNKEVLQYMQKYYQPKIDKYIFDIKNKIKNIKIKIENLEQFEKKNIENQIKILKVQKIVQIDEKIQKLKSQDIVKLEKEIEILRTQKIVKIDEKIEFLLDKKVPMLETKIEFYANNLDEYRKEIKKLYSSSKNNTESTIISIQMVNYQNLMLNAKNAMEDLNFELLDIKNNQILNLEREKENIEKVSIKDLELQIENIKNMTIANLEREKENITNENIRKLEHNLNVDLKNRKYNFEQEIKSYEYTISAQNLQNNNLVGEYVVKDYPVKPKKKLIVIVAFVTGFILSIFLVFFMEFIKGFKEEK